MRFRVGKIHLGLLGGRFFTSIVNKARCRFGFLPEGFTENPVQLNFLIRLDCKN